mmetsp:Transcript_87489/g.276457  ORF Transcript_87489/g.276457 Transcript_87489/m.276457 type:complete len:274 (-) Transcript_87489:51-872(-)
MSGVEDAQRHLVSSDLYREDALEADHQAVWGSFYDREAKRWGYACCQGTSRHQPCQLQEASGEPAKPKRKKARDDSSDSDSPRRRKEPPKEKTIDWSSAPMELPSPSPNARDDAALIEQVVRFGVGAWQREVNSCSTEGQGPPAPELAAFSSADALRQAQEALGPLLLQLQAGRVEAGVLSRLGEMLALAAEREYAAANKVYMELTMGNKRWQNVMAGAQGLHNKGASIKLIPQSKLNAFDSDPAAQKYIIALRRLIQFLQYKRPNEDVSKHM